MKDVLEYLGYLKANKTCLWHIPVIVCDGCCLEQYCMRGSSIPKESNWEKYLPVVDSMILSEQLKVIEGKHHG
jgi:hypothetical protein